MRSRDLGLSLQTADGTPFLNPHWRLTWLLWVTICRHSRLSSLCSALSARKMLSRMPAMTLLASYDIPETLIQAGETESPIWTSSQGFTHLRIPSDSVISFEVYNVANIILPACFLWDFYMVYCNYSQCQTLCVMNNFLKNRIGKGTVWKSLPPPHHCFLSIFKKQYQGDKIAFCSHNVMDKSYGWSIRVMDGIHFNRKHQLETISPRLSLKPNSLCIVEFNTPVS